MEREGETGAQVRKMASLVCSKPKTKIQLSKSWGQYAKKTSKEKKRETPPR